MRTKLSQKGQITVPKHLREQLGIRAGDELELIEDGGRLLVRKAPPSDQAGDADGVLQRRQGTDAAIRELRGLPDVV